jgi:hypothetical protein
VIECPRCGLPISPGVCAPKPHVFHNRPEQCVEALRASLARERARTEILRHHSNKDCLAMADDAIAEAGLAPTQAPMAQTGERICRKDTTDQQFRELHRAVEKRNKRIEALETQLASERTKETRLRLGLRDIGVDIAEFGARDPAYVVVRAAATVDRLDPSKESATSAITCLSVPQNAATTCSATSPVAARGSATETKSSEAKR